MSGFQHKPLMVITYNLDGACEHVPYYNGESDKQSPPVQLLTNNLINMSH